MNQLAIYIVIAITSYVMGAYNYHKLTLLIHNKYLRPKDLGVIEYLKKVKNIK